LNVNNDPEESEACPAPAAVAARAIELTIAAKQPPKFGIRSAVYRSDQLCVQLIFSKNFGVFLVAWRQSKQG
jgi:hypothetical protein